MTIPVITSRFLPATGGEAPTLVLGCSLGASTLLWSRAEAALRQHFSLLLWDNPGHGDSPKAKDSFTLEELATAVVQAVNEAGVNKFFVAGVSLGGGVAQQIAYEYPDRVLGAAALCSAAKFGTAEAWRERAAKVRAQGTSSLIAQSSERWFAKETFDRDPDIVGRLLHTLADADDESYALCCEALAAFDIRDRLSQIRVPVLALAGADDPATPPATLEFIAQSVPRGKFVVVPESSHFAVAEQPEAVAQELITFFQEN